MVPNCVCINLSQSHGEEKIKKWYFSIKVWAFDQVYKKCQKRDFSIFDLIFEHLPINVDGSMIPQKNVKPSSTRMYHNLPSRPTHAQVIALGKCTQCGWTVGKY